VLEVECEESNQKKNWIVTLAKYVIHCLDVLGHFLMVKGLVNF